MKTIHNDSEAIKDRLRFHIASALQEKEENSGECLYPEELTQLVEGKLSKKNANAMWAHIHACPACYDEWLAMPSPKRKKSFAMDFQNALSDICFFVSDFFHSLLIPKYGIPAFAVVMTCFIMVYIHVIRLSPFESYLNNSYQVVIEKNVQDYFVMPWEDHTQKALIGQGTLSMHQKAFALGLYHGRSELMHKAKDHLFSDQDAVSITKNETYRLFYITGKWIVLLQSAKIMEYEYSDQFWQENEGLLRYLLETLNNLETKTQECQYLYDKLVQLEEVWQKKLSIGIMAWQCQIGKICNLILQQFSPTYISNLKGD